MCDLFFFLYNLVFRCTFIDYTDNAEFWIRGYEVDDFRPRIEHLWKQIRPLYLQIHAYMRRKLWEQYGSSVISRRGPIPAHLLGKSISIVEDYMTRSRQSIYFLINFCALSDNVENVKKKEKLNLFLK